MTHEHPYLERLAAWARHEDAIRALVVTGSFARADGATDEFSDLDVQVITGDSKRYTADDSWLAALGEVWIRFPLNVDARYRLVWFSGGVKVDFQFVNPQRIRMMRQSGRLSDEYQRGYHIILDKDDLFRRLPPSPQVFPLAPSPTEAEVRAVINEFWFEAIHVAQFIRRREFWVVKHRDWTMKTNLLRLLEWHARETRAGAVNTWLLGRRITSWADAETRDAIENLWGRWDAPALWDALMRQLALFRRLARELSDAMPYAYDEKIYHEIEAYIGQLRREDRPAASTD